MKMLHLSHDGYQSQDVMPDRQQFIDEDTVLGTEHILLREMCSEMLKAKYLFNQNICEIVVEASFFLIFCLMKFTVWVCLLNI